MGLTRVFISYSHDSPEFMEAVLAFADKLRGAGIDARLDRYTPAPPEGWPRWMQHEIEKAEYVLLVCTENYHERVSMNAPAGKGLGVLWESQLIYQLLYDAGTVNSKFIPVLPPAGRTEHIPVMLRGVQRYEPFSEGGFEELYRRLTDQPAVSMPPLGPRHTLPPVQATAAVKKTSQATFKCVSSDHAVIVSSEDNVRAFIPVVEAQWSEHEVVLVLEPEDTLGGSFLSGLHSRQHVLLAYRTNVATCSVATVQQRSGGALDRWHITFEIHKAEFGSSLEFSMSGLSPDQAAVLRTRRLLLNENPTDPAGGSIQLEKRVSDATREIMIRGQQTEIEVERSPFPQLYQMFADRPTLFIQAAWIVAVLELKMSAAVERISRLELTLIGNGVEVVFEGQRRKQYSNHPAFPVTVSGTCQL